MSTRTAPSERPRTPAISAVDISSTNRRTTARRRSPGRRSTARHAAAASSRDDRVGLDVGGVRARRRRPRAAPRDGGAARGDARRRRCGRSGTARPGTSRRPSPSAGRARSSNRREVRERGEERPFGGVLGLVMVARARRPRSCTPGRRTSDTGPRTGPGPRAPPPPGAGRGRGGRGASGDASSGRPLS